LKKSCRLSKAPEIPKIKARQATGRSCPACHNPGLLDRWLRQEMGFAGFVTSDWGAVYGPDVRAAGTDLEMPGREIAGRGGPYFSEALKAAIEKGESPLSGVDQALSRILRQLDRFGLLAPSQVHLRRVHCGRRPGLLADDELPLFGVRQDVQGVIPLGHR